MKKEGKRSNEEEGEHYAEERLQERIETIRGEMESVPGGRLDACLAVSQGKFHVHFEGLNNASELGCIMNMTDDGFGR